MFKKSLLLLFLVIIIILFILVFNYNYHKSCPGLTISDINSIEITSIWFQGDLNNKKDIKNIVEYFNSLQLYSIGKYKFPHESADAYIKMYDDSMNLVYEIWCYGENGLIDVISNKRYYINESDMEVLYNILREIDNGTV